jgi:mevalonate kinase
MGQISATFCAAMQRESLDSTGVVSNVQHDAVLTLVRTNQSLLASLGVSHSSLDRICDAINNNSEFRTFAAAKLTGAGGGGCAMILLCPDIASGNPNATLEGLRSKIITTLQAAAQADYQFTFLSSTVGGNGVLLTSATDFKTVQCS